MTDKPRRAWFQLHLSTAIVLMLTMGILLGLNVPQYKASIEDIGGFVQIVRDERGTILARGWPWAFERVDPAIWNRRALNMDGLTAFVILSFAAYASERITRRREARAP